MVQRRHDSVIRVSNVGQAVAVWHFVGSQLSEEGRLSKRWITLSAKAGLLLPGQVTGR